MPILEAYMEMFPDIPIKDVYFFFDEIQRIKGWELFVLRLSKNYSKHIFISGSNADMLSEELNTALRGWPLEYKEYPLSFKEYCQFTGVPTDSYLEKDLALIRSSFDSFVRDGGYPEVVLESSRVMKDKLLQGYFNAMIFRDLMDRYKLSNPERVKYVIKRLMAGMTKPASINAIYNDMRSQGRKVSKDDLYDIADKTCSIFLLYKVTKFDQSFKKETSALLILGESGLVPADMYGIAALRRHDDGGYALGRLLHPAAFRALCNGALPGVESAGAQ